MNSPAEIRNDRFRDLEPRLRGLRLAVFEALQARGPCTTRVLAEAAALSILTVRPRVTELVELGLAVCTGREAHEGIYRACTAAEVLAARTAAAAPAPIQTEMRLT